MKFEHPITDPEPIDRRALTIIQIMAMPEPKPDYAVRLILSKLEPAWVIYLDHPTGQFAVSNPTGTEIRRFRTIKVLREALRSLNIDSIDIPVSSDRMRMHTKFLEDRLKWLQQNIRKNKMTNVSIGEALNLPNGYVSQCINGIGKFPAIEQYIAEKLSKNVQDLFPDIPDQVL